MRIIKDPTIGITAKDLFVLCAESFTDQEFKSRLLGYTDRVGRHAKDNQTRVPADIRAFLEEILPEQVSVDDMKKVYEEKLVKGKGRDYYKAILKLAPHRRCPICGVQRAETLDHYLPKSKVPTLAVDPGNLVPACDRCNRKKTAKLSSDPGEMPVHTYYDRIPDGKWLHVTLGDNLEAEYYIRCPDTEEWEPGIRSRVEHHLDVYQLDEVYSDEAAEELAIMKDAWTTELKDLQLKAGNTLPSETVQEEFRAFIAKRRESYELGDENSFASAFYRALEENIGTVYVFFGLKEPACAAR